MDAYAGSRDLPWMYWTAILPAFQQELAELLLRNRRFQIILAPLGVGIGGAFLGVGLEADIRRCLHELGQVVAVRHGCFKVLDGALADGELIAVRQQTVQPFQHPQQNASWDSLIRKTAEAGSGLSRQDVLRQKPSLSS